jgi:hypothetical protein
VKVISFSLWGDDPKYCRGAIRNAELARDIYPGWLCWFYIGESVPLDIQGELANMDHVDLFDIPAGYEGWKGMFARFLPGTDPRVDAFISRDCDSRLTPREKAAVDEWLASGFGFHCMRDHPHHTVPILGGMWGMKHGYVCPIEFGNIMDVWRKEDRWQTDQEWLKYVIWSRFSNQFLCHDDGFLTAYCGGQRFPTPRDSSGEFVGATYDENDIIDAEQVAALKGGR